MNKLTRGFTLIEILITLSIISILMAISLWSFQGARVAARDTKRKADLETIRSGLELYKADCGVYPVGPFPRTYTTYSTWPSSLLGTLAPPATCSTANTYLVAPKDPLDATRYYRYYSADGSSYCLATALEGGGSTVICNGINLCGASATCNYKLNNP